MRITKLVRRSEAAPDLLPDGLLTIADAYPTLKQSLKLKSRGAAGVVLRPVPTSEFTPIAREMAEVVDDVADGDGLELEGTDDPYAFRWLIVRSGTFDQLVQGVHAMSMALGSNGARTRLLCAVFSFADDRGQPFYWIYNYEQGKFYPLARSAPNRARDSERERRLTEEVEDQLPVEPAPERCLPLWGIPI